VIVLESACGPTQLNGENFGRVTKWWCWRAKLQSAVAQSERRSARTSERFDAEKSGASTRLWRQHHGAPAREPVQRAGGYQSDTRRVERKPTHDARNSLNLPASMPYCFILRCKVL